MTAKLLMLNHLQVDKVGRDIGGVLILNNLFDMAGVLELQEAWLRAQPQHAFLARSPRARVPPPAA